MRCTIVDNCNVQGKELLVAASLSIYGLAILGGSGDLVTSPASSTKSNLKALRHGLGPAIQRDGDFVRELLIRSNIGQPELHACRHCPFRMSVQVADTAGVLASAREDA